MQEPMEMNSDENNIQPNIENTQNTDNTANPENINAVPEYNPPQITIPQYSVPQYSVPQYTVPQYQEPQQNTIDNMQQYQPPTYPSFNPEPIVKQQDFNNQNNQNQVRNNGGCPNSWELFSFLTWILFLSSKWDIYRRSTTITNELYRPTLYNRSFVQLVTLIISVLGFLVYLKHIVYKKNENLYQALFNQYAKYHTFAFLLYSALAFTIEKQVMELRNMKNVSDSFNFKAFSAFYMIFSLLTLFCIIFVYMCTDMVCDWYIVMSIKKGIYSVIIAETTQYFIESIFFARFASIVDSDSSSGLDMLNLYKTGGVFFCILIFAIVCVFSILKKDIIMMLINFLMYCGMIFNFYTSEYVEVAKGIPVVCIIVVVCQFVIMAIMVIKFKEQLIES